MQVNDPIRSRCSSSVCNLYCAVAVQAFGQSIEDNVTGYYGSTAPSPADNNPFVERTITAPVRYNQACVCVCVCMGI